MKDSRPTVSIIMNCHNCRSFLRESLDSVILQTYQDWEIVFWDNASSDDSADIIKSYNNSKINYYRTEELVPLYTARNLALKKCKGEYISFLDCDDVWLEDKLLLQIKEAQKGAMIVYGGYDVINEKGVLLKKNSHNLPSGRVTNKSPLVSIMMNCYNSDTYLKESIDCVIKQTHKDWEIIFWDNQSTDNSAKIVKSYNDKRIKYYYAPEHTSLYEARNCALKYCDGEYLAFLDCDDLWMPEKLEKQINIFKNKVNVVLVHTNTIFFNSDTNKERILNKTNKISGYIFRENLINYQFSLETVMVRMDTIRSNKLDFGKRFNMIGDRDFFSMVCFYGEAYYIDQVLGKWRIHADNYSKVLHNDHPKELKYMYLRFKKRFNCNFTKEMRMNIYNEIALREALNVFQKSSIQARKKLNKIHIFNLKGLTLRILTYFPKKMALNLLDLLKQN